MQSPLAPATGAPTGPAAAAPLSNAEAPRAVSTADLAGILARTVADPHAACIEHRGYLALFGIAAPRCTAREAYREIADCLASNRPYDPQ